MFSGATTNAREVPQSTALGSEEIVAFPQNLHRS